MSSLDKKLLAAGLRPPKTVTLVITNGCNLKCNHCWPEACSVESAQPVPESIIRRLINELNQLNVEAICLTGGEPFTHPDWQKIITKAIGPTMFKRVVLQTNGTLLDTGKVQILKNLAAENLEFHVSLDGVNHFSHDMVRSEGSFESAIRGLKNLAAAGLGKKTQVLFTEMRHNISELPKLLKLIDELGLAGCVSGTLVSQGRARDANGITLPMPSQYEELLKLYQENRQFRDRYERLGNFPALEWFKGKSYPTDKRCACIETPYIDVRGRIFPCHMMPAPQFAVDGAHQRPLITVLTEALPVWTKLPKINLDRRKALPLCKACPGRQHCAGGCLGRAYAAFGDLLTVEDRCGLRKAVYSWKEQT
jgi:radical SAM protein with 4Fe4S-binding SPASM domain